MPRLVQRHTLPGQSLEISRGSLVGSVQLKSQIGIVWNCTLISIDKSKDVAFFQHSQLPVNASVVSDQVEPSNDRLSFPASSCLPTKSLPDTINSSRTQLATWAAAHMRYVDRSPNPPPNIAVEATDCTSSLSGVSSDISSGHPEAPDGLGANKYWRPRYT